MTPRAHETGAFGSGIDRAADKRRLKIVLALTAGYMLAEVVGGFWTGSLALLADAGHMLTDVASLALALWALTMAERPATTMHTYTLARVEILAALLNGLALWAIVVWIAIEAVGRLQSPEPVESLPMILIAMGGLVVNGIAVMILHRGHREGVGSLNVHGAVLHVMGDLLGSVGAVIAGVVILTTGWIPADPIASLAIGALILVASWRLVREAVHILLEAAPRDLDMERLIGDVCRLEGVVSLHDLHVWTITSGYTALSAHIVGRHGVEPGMLLARVNRLLRERFGITHTTIQIELETPPDHTEPMSFPVPMID